ncbi:MAG: biopolymer transporter ExbD [Chthoniobacterales bacterium]
MSGHGSSGSKKHKIRRAATETDPEFQIAPMIDILLVLLVFFMSISSTELLQSNHSVNLPVAKDAKVPGQHPGQVIINVMYSMASNTTSIEVNDKTVSMTDLVGSLSAHAQKNPLVRVVIRADRDVRYEFMRTLLEAVGKSGIANVTFSVADKAVPKS